MTLDDLKNKEDLPSRLLELSGVPEKFWIPAAHWNFLVDFVENLDPNSGGGTLDDDGLLRYYGTPALMLAGQNDQEDTDIILVLDASTDVRVGKPEARYYEYLGTTTGDFYQDYDLLPRYGLFLGGYSTVSAGRAANPSPDEGAYYYVSIGGKVYQDTYVDGAWRMTQLTIVSGFVEDYDDVDELIQSQGSQVNGSVYLVLDAGAGQGADPDRDPGEAVFYKYLGTTNGDLSDYSAEGSPDFATEDYVDKQRYSRVEVSGSRFLTANDNGNLLVITADIVLTLPDDGLPDFFNFNYKVRSTGKLTVAKGNRSLVDRNETAITSAIAEANMYGHLHELADGLFQIQGETT